jgi:hypothetical protein
VAALRLPAIYPAIGLSVPPTFLNRADVVARGAEIAVISHARKIEPPKANVRLVQVVAQRPNYFR